MDWILEHLQVVLAIAGAIAYWINSLRKKAGERANPPRSDRTGPQYVDRGPGQAVENAEHTRRIQEEIRRKIAERQAGANRPLQPAATPVPPRLSPAGPDLRRRRERETEAPYAQDSQREQQARETASVLERQRELSAQLAALEKRRAAATSEREVVAAWAKPRSSVEGVGDLDLVRELRQASSLRKAIVLREVLGTPVGLR